MKILWNITRTILTLAAWLAGGYVLHKYEYFKAFGAVDNVAGTLPVAMVITAATGAAALLWMKHSRQYAPVSAALALLAALSVALFPTALRKDWRLNLAIPKGAEARPDMTVYAPFAEASQTAKLAEKSTLTLTSGLPTLDGATALYPVYAALAEAAYDRAAFSPDDVRCTSTRQAYEAVISGQRDIIFVAAASARQLAAAQAAGADLRFTPIGREAFVFVAGRGNPVDDLSYQQVRNIYSGKTARWKTLGWPEGGDIIAFQRPEGSGSQTGLQSVMGGLPIQAPQPLPDASLLGSGSLMKQVSVEWQGVQPALGYSYRYFATAMYANPDAKLLKINGVAPTIENIRNARYPFTGDFYAVTNGAPHGNVKTFIDWILSPQGQELIENQDHPLSGWFAQPYKGMVQAAPEGALKVCQPH
ncbi:MAG: extracellular solute-binding protein, partial [Candidatus Adiutrix sp.]|nr:extracellular solute-binding protein [Candidatus Adiutrix sp.]